MTASLDLFRSLASTLDLLVPKVDEDLPLADDIHPSIRRVGDYAADLLRLPKELAKLEAQKASADAYVPTREKALRAANRAVAMQEAKIEKLGKSIDRNRSLLAEMEDQPSEEFSTLNGTPFPTRTDLIENLRQELLAAEDGMQPLRAKVKKAESNLKGALTRVANLAHEVLAARWAIVDHEGRLEEVIKVLRKTITHLRNRQEKRDAKKRASARQIEVTDAVIVDEAPKAPTDEDVIRKAAEFGISIDSPDDLEAARTLFLN